MESKQLFNSDCFEIMKGWSDNSIDLVLSDPPYGVNFSKIQGDSKEDVVSWIPEFMNQSYRILKDNCYCFLFVGVKNIENWIIAGKESGLYSICNAGRLFF
jgi:site-specific DNA-methyltransferase (adenine-specific)